MGKRFCSGSGRNRKLPDGVRFSVTIVECKAEESATSPTLGALRERVQRRAAQVDFQRIVRRVSLSAAKDPVHRRRRGIGSKPDPSLRSG
jgi:hypothetical protein